MKAKASCKPLVGQIVRVRPQHWLIEDVVPSPLDTWLHLSCMEDDAQGESLEVLWEAELGGLVVLAAEAWAKIGRKGFDDTRHFAYFNTLRWHCITAPGPKFYGPSRQARRQGRNFVGGHSVITRM